jgi:hypothetical protein
VYYKVVRLTQKDEIEFLKFQISLIPETKSCDVKEHMNLLHEYNEIKDIGQILIGKIAELKGTTCKHIYTEYDLEIDS